MFKIYYVAIGTSDLLLRTYSMVCIHSSLSAQSPKNALEVIANTQLPQLTL